MPKPKAGIDFPQATAVFVKVTANVGTAISGHKDKLRLLLAAFAAGGHVLLEDYPDTGKTTLAKAIAQSVGADFKRVQFTPDLLPSDILGVSVFDQQSQSFNFREGPIFTHLLLADEINRASPRTQSALLEAMAEGQVSVEGNTHRLAEPFLVIATQNPVEFRGTYPLPEAQMDRFALRLQLGYLDAETEVEMVAAQDQGHPLDDLESIASLQDILNLRQVARGVRVSDELRRYAIELIRATRTAPSVQLGAGPRASLALLHTARALALLDGLDYVRPDHVHELAVPVIAHRLVVESGARFGGLDSSSVVQDILDSTPMPQ